MTFLTLFILGLLIGSFLNVVTLRYAPGKPILGRHIMGGRSRCPRCREELHWYELIPLLSFIIQRGTCRHCFEAISWQYPFVEIITGFITAGVPLFLYSYFHVAQLLLQHQSITWFYFFAGLWLIASYALITLSVIDIRLKIIPDASNILVAIVGIGLLVCKNVNIQIFKYSGSFLGPYTQVLGQQESGVMNIMFALALALIVFGGVILLTRGRGMGMGDLKLALAIGVLLGWPDVIIAYSSAFIIGSLVGILFLLRKTKKMKDAIPFGPYLALGVFVTMLYGESILQWYFGLVK